MESEWDGGVRRRVGRVGMLGFRGSGSDGWRIMAAAPSIDRAVIERIVRQIVLRQPPSVPERSVAADTSPDLVVSISARQCT